VKELIRRLANRFTPGLFINNGEYWDRYVRLWKLRGGGKQYETVGMEWKGQETFLALLGNNVTKESRVLEIGCGGGRITLPASSMAESLIATDPSKNMLRVCKQYLAAKTNVRYEHTDGFTLQPVTDASVDMVFSHDVFVHFSALQVYASLLEIRRVLQPGGTVLISFYGIQEQFALFADMSARFAAMRIMPPHMRVHFVSEDQIRLLFAQAGFEITNVDASNFLIVTARSASPA
jgi:ubiquinone/menaquinone biosynthesis C-methylase UbiE